MLKLVIKNEGTLRFLLPHPFLSKFFVYKLNKLAFIDDNELSNLAYRLLSVDGIITKHTSYDRFNDLDEITCGLLDRSASQYSIHDIAASSGLATAALHERLSKNGVKHQIFISDKYSKFYCQGDSFCAVYDSDNSLVQVECFWLLADQRLSPKYFLSKLAFLIIKRIFSDINHHLNDPFVIQTYAPHVLEKIKNGDIIDIKYDVFTSIINKKFDFVRVMNLLNNNFFEEKKIIMAIKNIFLTLNEGGLLLIGRTTSQNINNASFYRKENNRLKLIKAYNTGSELNDIIQHLNFSD